MYDNNRASNLTENNPPQGRKTHSTRASRVADVLLSSKAYTSCQRGASER